MLENNLHDMFIQEATKIVFQIVLEEDSENWCIKKSLLKLFNQCVKQSSKSTRQKTRQNMPIFFL